MNRIARAARRVCRGGPRARGRGGGRGDGWVKDELSLNLRTGPGNEYRIKGFIKTGDSVTMLSRREDWVQVRTRLRARRRLDRRRLPVGGAARRDAARAHEDRDRGGARPVRVAHRAREAARGRERQAHRDRDVAQKEELETLTRDNMELRAGARWPEWITGACLLAVGMLMGAIVQSVNGRRARPRIRL